MNRSLISATPDYLDAAGNMLEKMDIKDLAAPTLLDVTKISQHGIATASGLSDFEYQSLSNLAGGHKQLTQVNNVTKIPIPSEILDHFKHVKCQCMMGLFPEIGRAWLTIDSELYIWSYEHTKDVAYYDGLNSTIVSVGLVKPKPNIFIADVKYLLILTTPTEILVLGVTFGDTAKRYSSPVKMNSYNTKTDEIQLLSKPIFHLDSENVAINVVEGTDNGRIFLGGRDGYLYELIYQAESNWFGKRCRKVNISQSVMAYMVPNFLKVLTPNDPVVQIAIDNTRSLLYLLTEKGTIEAYEYGADPTAIRRFAKVSQHTIAQLAGNIAKTVEADIFKPIARLCILTYTDCPAMNLVLITETGARLYFSVNQQCLQASAQDQNSPAKANVPSMLPTSHISPTKRSPSPTKLVTSSTPAHSKPACGLYLMHVRLPPGYTPNTTIIKPKLVHAAHYSEGNLLLVSTTQQNQDLLWAVSSAPFLNRPFFAEAIEIVAMEGIIWKMANIPNRSNVNSVLRKSQQPSRMVLLSNQGAHLIELLKSADILQQLLTAYRGPHHTCIKLFFQAQTDIEACITCLIIACCEQNRGSDIAMWATQAFLLYGGDPTYQRRLQPHNGNIEGTHQPIVMSTPIPNQPPASFSRMGSQSNLQMSQFPLSPVNPLSTINATFNNSNDSNNIIYSAKHDSLYIYAARSLRPVLKKRCVDSDLRSTVNLEDCTMVLEDLNALKLFLETTSINDLYGNSAFGFNNQGIIQNGYNQMMHTPNFQNQNEQRSVAEHLQLEEKRSVTALIHFIRHACEVVALWKVLCENPFVQLADYLNPEQRTVLASCSFYDLILSRGEICGQIIIALVNSYIKDKASVGNISAKLREVCPTLYRHEDAVSFKATEMMMEAKSCMYPHQKMQIMQNALNLCKETAPNIPLHTICQQFTLAKFFGGVIDLSHTCATKCDPEEYGIHFYKNDEPAEDSEGYTYFAKRINCYKEVREMLERLYDDQGTTFKDTEQEEDGTHTNEEILKIVQQSVQIKDPLLHITIYEWLMSHDLISLLLSIVEPSLGDYLRRNVMRFPDNYKVIDLLWKYYEKNGHHAQAAKILDNLASMETDAIPLDKRVEYLARAVMCMRNDNIGYSVQNGVLLKDVEDRMDIARVQKFILNSISAISPQTAVTDRAIQDLNNKLYDITDLYQQFAETFNLWECKLTILNCSHHNDTLLIESVWQKIISNTIQGCSTPTERVTRLFTKIESLVKEFSQSGNCFPLAFIIHELEKMACIYSMPEAIVPDKLLAMNIDIEMMLEYYFRMIIMNERIWTQEGNEWHLVESCILLTRTLADTVDALWCRSKRRIIGKALDIISSCLNLCYQKPSTESMQQALKQIQCQLQRSL